MHDSTRRLICRVAFVCLCLLPSSSLSVWALYRVSPVYAWQARRQWERVIHDTTGLLASIDSVHHPTHTRTLLQEVEFTDPDGWRLVAKIRVLEVTRAEHGLVIRASQPEIASGQMRRLGEVLHDRVLRGVPPTRAVHLLAGEVTLAGEKTAITFRNLHAAVASNDGVIRTTIDFSIAGFDTQQSAQLQITRQPGVSPSTLWQFRTGSAPLPCELWCDYLPSLACLGERCRFAGNAWVEQREASWDGELVGHFQEVDLESLMEPFPHKLSGVADLTLSHARFVRGRLTEAAGALRAEGGVVSRSLLEAAAESLRLEGETESESADSPLTTYEQLAFGFHLDHRGLRLSGLCDGPERNVMMQGSERGLLFSSSEHAVSAIALTRTLVPDAALWVPATNATATLFHALPLPDAQPSASRTATRPYLPMRLRD